MRITGRVRNPDLPASAGYGIVETLIVLIVISVLVVVVMARYERMYQEARIAARDAELANLRTTISLYRMKNGRFPRSLEELFSEKYLYPTADPGERLFRQKYLERIAAEDDRQLKDPLGRPYLYNTETGDVSVASQMRGGR